MDLFDENANTEAEDMSQKSNAAEAGELVAVKQ